MPSVYITSCKHRTAQQNETITECAKHGFNRWRTIDYMRLGDVDISTPLVVTQTCHTPPIAGNHKLSGVATMQHAAKYGADWLHFEDDILLADDFNIFLDMAQNERDRVTYFYFNDFEPRVFLHYPKPTWERIKRKLPINRVLLPTVTNKYLYGCQAVFIPHEILTKFLADDRIKPQNKPLPFDVMLCALVADLTKGALVALPHPVQHRADITEFTNHEISRKRSGSFDVPRQ